MTIAVDFDGTCVTHAFPNMGEEIGAVPVLKKLTDLGHKLILFTMRSDREEGDYLTQAINWFEKHEIPLYGVQTNPTQHTWTTSPKAYAHMYIDDAALGVPLIINEGERAYVDWKGVEDYLYSHGILKDGKSTN